MQELRTEPRQRRSQQSIDAILDAAERLIAEQGQVGFTANELAAAAGMSIGRVYYWFPDIPAVVTALVERSAVRMADVFGRAITNQYGTTTPLLLQRAIRAMCVYIEANPAAVALSLTGGAAGPGRVMHDRLVEFASALVCDRVPGIPDHEVELCARTAVGITLGMLNGYNEVQPQYRPFIEQELVYVLSAYLYSRFPPPNDFTWTTPDRAVQPSRPSRRDFTESNQVWPALAPDQPS
ncbi:MAG: TetR/AcrR family transcriptional regulator [Ilumatobacteraceae bacterium]